MWVPSLLHTSRVQLRRSLSLLAAPLVLATLLTIFMAPTTHAADAIWQGTELHYQDNVYEKVSSPPNRSDTPNEYEWRDTSTNPDTAQVLYFGDNPTSSKSATLVTYDVSGNSYRNASSPQKIDVTRDLLDDAEGTTQTEAGTTCNTGGGLGWIICPVANYLAEGVDWVYGLIENFLEVQTIQNNDNGVYQLWQVFRTIANVCFILVFLAIIYSQITGAGYSNYNLKKMLPRLVVGAVLVNISFLVCSLAVDASNLLGYSIQSIFVSIRETLPTNADVSGDGIGWGTLTALVIGGGAAAGVGGLAAATAFSGGAMSFLLVAILIPIGMAVLVAFTILAARQAIIVVLTIISPLAFVAFILPGTSSWFDRWRKSFTTMLIFFPIFALLFGGSQLAGTAIINTTPSVQDSMKIPMILIGLGAMAAPLVLTPFLIRFSGGILGQIANITNNKGRGIADRAKNWANDNADMHKARKLSGFAEQRENRLKNLQNKIDNGEKVGKWQQRRARRTPLPLRMDQKKRERDDHKKQSESVLAAHHDRQWQRDLADPVGPNRIEEAFGRRSLAQRTSDQYHLAHHLHNQAEGEKAANDAKAGLHWQQHLRSEDGVRDRHVQKEAALLKGETGIMDDQIKAQDERLFRDTVLADRGLRKRIVETGEEKHRAQQAQNIVDKRSEANWENLQKTDAAVRTRRLEETELDDSVKLAQQEWNSIIEGIRAKGDAMPGLAQADKSLAASIKKGTLDLTVENSVQESAKVVQQANVVKHMEDDAVIKYAAGVGGHDAERRVIAKVKSLASSPIVDAVKEIKNTQDWIQATDADGLLDRFKQASTTIEEKIAIAGMLTERGGPGHKAMIQAFDHMDKNYSHNDGDMQLFKELVMGTSSASKTSKAAEFWLTNAKVGNRAGTISELSNAASTWTAISAQAFANMNQIHQAKALRTLATQQPASYEKLRKLLLNDDTTMSNLKVHIADMLELSANDPEYTNPNSNFIDTITGSDLW